MSDLASLTAADFEPRLNSAWTLSFEEGSFAVELAEVRETEQPGTDRRQFSVVFRGGPTPPLPQAIRRLEDEVLGTLELFLVPLGPGEAGAQRYEAVFT